MKKIDLIKENGKYLFICRKNGNVITSEVNTKIVNINGNEYKMKKPFANISKFEHFCVETNLIK